MHAQNMAKVLIIIGILLLIAGLLYYFFGDKLHWIGRLPGDIRYEKGNTKVFFPISTMILLSLLLNLLIYLFKKLF